jgi:hypothetical protein
MNNKIYIIFLISIFVMVIGFKSMNNKNNNKSVDGVEGYRIINLTEAPSQTFLKLPQDPFQINQIGNYPFTDSWDINKQPYNYHMLHPYSSN